MSRAFGGCRVFIDDVDISDIVHEVSVLAQVDAVTETRLVLYVSPVIDEQGNMHLRTGARSTHLQGPSHRAITLRPSEEPA